MNTWAILPLRSLHDGKRRLQHTLSVDERTALVQQLFAHTLRAISAARAVEDVCVVTPDPEVQVWLHNFDVLCVRQPDQGLNAGLEYARQTLLGSQQPDALLVVLPDLPLLTPGDIAKMVGCSTPRSVVLAPDRHGQGTNALLVRPAGTVPFCFGEGSLYQHTAAAAARGFHVYRYDAPGTAFDVDTPDDLERMQQSAERSTQGSEMIEAQYLESFCVSASL
jgi:2-phospho-L-lactate guanylyltransferase